MNRIAGLFPGQGSQCVGMGSSFAAQSEFAQDIFDTADKALGFKLSALCKDGPIEQLTLTENAQPAILTVSYIAFKSSEIELAAAAGHSLGEYTALVAAKSLAFEDAVALVNARGRYMQEAVAPGKGKMVAVLGPSEAEITEVLSSLSGGVVEIANLNSPGQTVLAGELESVDAFSETMTSKGAKVIPLNVSAPFHCSLMKPAQEKLSKDLDAISFSAPAFPVYANVTAKAVEGADSARELLKKQVCSSVRWTESILSLCAQEQISHTVEFGAGGVLSKLMKRIDKSVARLEVSSPESMAKAQQALATS